MTHTPGPWHRNIRAGGKYPIIFSGRNKHVAQACQQRDPAETESNIDLIAAAPDLLAALELVCQQLRAEEPYQGEPTFLSQIRAAIARAKGEA